MSGQKLDPQAGQTSISSGPATEEGIGEFLRGKNHMKGGRHDYEMRGLTSDQRAEPTSIMDPGVTMLDANENTYAQDQEGQPQLIEPAQPAQTEPQDFQKMYGDSENEKGAWRKTAQDLMETNGAMLEELKALRQAQTPQPQAYQQPAPPRLEDQLPKRFLPDKAEDDLVSVSDVERLLHEQVAPAVWQLSVQANTLAQTQHQGLKAAAGITPAVEADLCAKYPWIAQLPEGPAKVQAMQTVSQQAQAPAPQPTPQPNAAPVQAAARRVTYIEPSNAAKSSGESPSVDQLFAQEMDAAIAKPFTERRSAMEAVYRKYGVQHTNDFRGGSVLTR